MSTRSAANRSLYPVACFRTPAPEVLGKGSLLDIASEVKGDQDFNLSALRTNEAEALGRLAPFLLCGEESAVLVFYRESRRGRQKAHSAAYALMRQVAGEEKVHEQMLAHLTSQLPSPAEMPETRKRAHDFYVGMASKHPALHFSRVAALDSGVCKIMAALCAAPAVMNCPSVHRIFNKIRSDESRHVRISRRYVLDLGEPLSTLLGAVDQVCADLVTLLEPAGEAFENVGVDADQLFRRIKRQEMP